MSTTVETLAEAFASASPVSRSQVMGWWREAQDIETRAARYDGVSEAYDQIQPPLGTEETCRIATGYLLECVRLDPKEEGLCSRYEAALELEGWFDHMADSEQEEATPIMRATAAAVTALYLDRGPDVQVAIETGFLEHVLEQERLRHWFAHWAVHDRLSQSWHAALAWGVETFYERCVANGVTIIKPLAATAWGTKDFYVEDPDGYIISFGGSPTAG
jgi:uncharacterized glyoxalase superfamily protein PhnB